MARCDPSGFRPFLGSVLLCVGKELYYLASGEVCRSVVLERDSGWPKAHSRFVAEPTLEPGAPGHPHWGLCANQKKVTPFWIDQFEKGTPVDGPIR